MAIEMRVEVVTIAVSDIDRARDFYAKQIGWNVDHDSEARDGAIRFVQITPPGSHCSITFGRGLTDNTPGSSNNVMLVIDSAKEAYDFLNENGVQATAPDEQEWGTFVTFEDPDGNQFTLQELPDYAKQ